MSKGHILFQFQVDCVEAGNASSPPVRPIATQTATFVGGESTDKDASIKAFSAIPQTSNAIRTGAASDRKLATQTRTEVSREQPDSDASVSKARILPIDTDSNQF